MDEQQQIAEFVKWRNNPLDPFPYPKNWSDLCSLCKLKAVSAVAQEHGRIAELYNNNHKTDFLYPIYLFGHRVDSRRDCSWLGVRLQANVDYGEMFICALDTVPLVCECKKIDLAQAEKDAIFQRAHVNKIMIDPWAYRGG